MAQSRKGDIEMKKYLALICTIACIFGLTACGGESKLTDYEQQKVDIAKQHATQQIIPLFEDLVDNGAEDILAEYTAEEIEYSVGTNYSMNVDGNAVQKGISSFASGLKSIGSIVSVGEADAVIDGSQIIVNVQIDGELKDAEAEVVLSNDMFFSLESISLNPVSTMGELMERAALNTLLGMGTVFCVLILISIVISCFKFISVAQEKAAKKAKEAEAAKAPAPAPAVQEVVEEASDETDDLELVAVIAAAIAASEGAVTTDGFVVRSIRKVNRSRR